MENRNTGHIEIQNYYNSISNDYDAKLSTEDNVIIRNYVKDYFLKNVQSCAMMDFGGGTGLDTLWLLANNYSVNFCEPSDGMRAIAVKKIKQLINHEKINVLTGMKTDFNTWDENNLPCPKVDAVLANFNVLNNIKGINLLFEKFNLIMNEGAHFICTLLDYSFFTLLRLSKTTAYKSLFSKAPLQLTVKSGNNSHKAFIYSDNHLRKGYSNYFKLVLDEPIHKSGFRLVHLQKFN